MPKLLLLIALFFLCAPHTGMAQSLLEPSEDVAKKEHMNTFFENCMESLDESVSYDSQADTCVCETLHMGEHLTASEIEILATGEGSGYVDKENYFLNVVAPCLEFMGRDDALYKCYGDNLIKSSVTTQNAYQAICQCYAQEAAGYFRDLARPQLEVLMERNPILEDPYGAIKASHEYLVEMSQARSQCLNTYGKAWDDHYRSKRYE